MWGPANTWRRHHEQILSYGEVVIAGVHESTHSSCFVLKSRPDFVEDTAGSVVDVDSGEDGGVSLPL